MRRIFSSEQGKANGTRFSSDCQREKNIAMVEGWNIGMMIIADFGFQNADCYSFCLSQSEIYDLRSEIRSTPVRHHL
jgi:hypothetical protein